MRDTQISGADAILQLWSQVGISIDEETAARRASELAGTVPFAVVDALVLRTYLSGYTTDDPYRGIEAARLIDVVARNLPPAERECAIALWIAALESYIEFVSHVGDADVQAEALTCAESLLEQSTTDAEKGEAYLYVGLLYAQSITAGTNLVLLPAFLINRLDRAHRPARRQTAESQHQAWQLVPVTTLTKGLRAFDEALQLGKGSTIANAALQYLTTARYLEHVGKTDTSADQEQLVLIARRGLASAQDNVGLTAGLISELHVLDVPDHAEEERLLGLDLLELANQGSDGTAMAVATYLAITLLDRPFEGAKHAVRCAQLAMTRSESSRSTLLNTAFNLLSIPMQKVMRTREGYTRGEDWMRAFLRAESLSSYEQLGVLVATVSADPDLPGEVCDRLLSEAVDINQEHELGLAPVLVYAIAAADIRLSVEAYKKGDLDEYMHRQASAIPMWLAIGMHDAAREVLSKINNVLSETTEDVTIATARALLPHVAVLEAMPLVDNAVALQRIWRRLTALAIDHKSDIHTVVLLLQLAKSARTAAILRRGPLRFNVEPDTPLRKILAQADALRAKLNSERADKPTARHSYRLVVPYQDRIGNIDSTDEAVQASNLERAFDARLQQELLLDVGQCMPRSVEEILDVLEPDDVLWSILVCQDIRSRPAVVSALLVPDGRCYVQTRVVEGIDKRYAMTDEYGDFVFTDLEGAVALARLVLAEASDDAAAEKAVDALNRQVDELFPEIVAHLDMLHAEGYRRLIIDSHGPFHVYPFHLFGPRDMPLGGKWSITSTPCIEALFADTREHPGRSTAVEVFGMTFRDGGGHGQPPLWGVHSETQAVAGPFGATPHLDAECTVRAIRMGLESARFVHIASHGRQDVAAPSLQEVYATAADGDNGVLRAFEILENDLAGLELVTLSACDTALGRVDTSDNPRGLAAAVLLGGAQAVVGTIWEVGDAAARTFFRTLYSALAEGESRKAAFNRARQQVRERHRLPCEWGAFVYLGT